MTEQTGMELEPTRVVDATLVSRAESLEAQERVQCDVQITTAKRYPRSVAQAVKTVEALAMLDQQTAEECFYALSRSGKSITGPSVRLAEIVAHAWGNLSVATRIVSIDATRVVAQSVCHDLETNLRVQPEAIRRITNKNGQRFNEDMINTTANAAMAVAYRNSIFKVVPGAVFKAVFDKVRSAARGDEKTMGVRLVQLYAYFEGIGVDKKRVLAAVDAQGDEDITLDSLELLRGLATAIKEGTSSVEDAFPGTAPDKPKAEPKKGRKTYKKAAPKAKPEPTSDPKVDPPPPVEPRPKRTPPMPPVSHRAVPMPPSPDEIFDPKPPVEESVEPEVELDTSPDYPPEEPALDPTEEALEARKKATREIEDFIEEESNADVASFWAFALGFGVDPSKGWPSVDDETVKTLLDWVRSRRQPL